MSSNLTDVVFGSKGPDYGARGGGPLLIGVMAEWLRRQTRNLVGSALVGSNPADVVLLPSAGSPKLVLREKMYLARHFVRVVKELAC